MVDDEPLGTKLLKTSRKRKEKKDEFPDSTPSKERKYYDDRVGRMSMQTFMNKLGEFPDLTPTKERLMMRRTNELPENYFVFEVHYDGVFSEYPLRYEPGNTLTLKL
nr:hypothetical protein [Tanacetum cinerariifolium]